MPGATVPAPSAVVGRVGKYYLPAFNIVVTAPSVEAAAALEQGLLELVQYRGNCVACFDVAMQRADNDTSDPLRPTDTPRCIVAAATRAQLFASVAIGNEARDAEALLEQMDRCDPPLEEWERAYVAATAKFLQYDYEEATALCLQNLEREPFDGFSARLLLITTYLGSHQDALCDGFSAVTYACEGAIAAQAAGTWKGPHGPHALQLALPYWMAWAAFGFEESRRDVDAAERLARKAVQQTINNNARYFPSQSLSVDQPGATGALLAADPSFGFTCVFAIHVVLHCFETRGDPAGALAALNAFDAPLWTKAVHLARHLRWHVATFKLECGDVVGAIDDFEAYLSDPAPDDPYDLADTTAFAWRLWNAWHHFTNAGRKDLPWAAIEDVSRVVAGAHHVHELWSKLDGVKLRKVPFFAVHRYAAALVVLSSNVASKTFTVWPCDAERLRALAGEVKGRGGQRLTWNAFCDTWEHAVALQGEQRYEEILGALMNLLDSSVANVSARVHAAGLPMGGSVAQMRLVTFPLQLALLSAGAPGAINMVRTAALQMPRHPLVVALVPPQS